MIAFAYCDRSTEFAPMYQAMAEAMVKNVREVMPDQEILMITDDTTPMTKGINKVLRIERTTPLMPWRLKAHQYAHDLADEIVFVEPDVRFKANVMKDFDRTVDIAVTTREDEVLLENERLNTPFTLGMTFSRNAEFWRQAKLYCQGLSAKDQDWFGDMLSIAHVIASKAFNVTQMDGSIYNHVVNDPYKPTDAKVLHYKGKRKAWLFPKVVEEAEA